MVLFLHRRMRQKCKINLWTNLLVESALDPDEHLTQEAALPHEPLDEPKAGHVSHDPSSAPAVLIGIICVKFALPEKAIKALLELLRLKPDVSSIKNVGHILHIMEILYISISIRFYKCARNLSKLSHWPRCWRLRSELVTNLLHRCYFVWLMRLAAHCSADREPENFVMSPISSQLRLILKGDYR